MIALFNIIAKEESDPITRWKEFGSLNPGFRAGRNLITMINANCHENRIRLFQVSYGIEMAILGDEHFPLDLAKYHSGAYPHPINTPVIDSGDFLAIAQDLVLTPGKVKRWENLALHLKSQSVQMDAVIEKVIGVNNEEERITAYMVHVLHVPHGNTAQFKRLVKSISNQSRINLVEAARMMMKSHRTLMTISNRLGAVDTIFKWGRALSSYVGRV